ncbi:MAG: hypothetical protein H7A36_02780 [Chlamydiales bacterium]|nr:hypothetical protein [Chlamydiales bacterium]
MRFEIVFVSLVALLLAAILLGVGVVMIFSPFYPLPYQAIATLFQKPLFFGVLFVVVAALLIAAFLGLTRRRYLRFKMGGYSLSEAVLTRMARKNLEELFPKDELFCEVVVRRGKKLNVTAHLPPVEEKTLEEVEERLTALFQKQCGFHNHFYFNVSTRSVQSTPAESSQ